LIRARIQSTSLVAILSALVLLTGCTSATASITGTLFGADGRCLYIRGLGDHGSDLYWLRQLPRGYEAIAEGLRRPDGSHFSVGETVTVSGVLSWLPFERECQGAHTLDVTAVEPATPVPSTSSVAPTGSIVVVTRLHYDAGHYGWVGGSLVYATIDGIPQWLPAASV
jgi:hypothetical protein